MDDIVRKMQAIANAPSQPKCAYDGCVKGADTPMHEFDEAINDDKYCSRWCELRDEQHGWGDTPAVKLAQAIADSDEITKAKILGLIVRYGSFGDNAPLEMVFDYLLRTKD